MEIRKRTIPEANVTTGAYSNIIWGREFPVVCRMGVTSVEMV